MLAQEIKAITALHTSPVLVYLSQQKNGEARYMEIQRAVNIKPVPLSRALKSIVKVGLTTRHEEKLCVTYRLTDRGQKAATHLHALTKL